MHETKMLLVLLIPGLLLSATLSTAAAETQELSKNSEDWKADSSGYESDDGIWELIFPGHGYAEMEDNVLMLRPELEDNERHSTLVLADEIEYKGIHGQMEVMLEKQSDDPENWDSFWAMLAYVDSETQINLLIKSDEGGWKVTKRDHDHKGQDLHETIAEGDEIPEAEFGHWYEVEWWIAPNPETDNLHVRVAVDGEVLVDTEDTASWDRNGDEGKGTSEFFLEADKTAGAYSEKSYSSWRSIEVEEMEEWRD